MRFETIKNEYEDIYLADIGKIVKLVDPKSINNNKLMYESGITINGYCYKDYNTFMNKPNGICYIAECEFDDDLFVDYVVNNKDKWFKTGVISTANSIKDEIKNNLVSEDYYYRYEKNGIVYTIKAKNFDEKLINQIARDVFYNVDWQTIQSYIYETDWRDVITYYYRNKLRDKEHDL